MASCVRNICSKNYSNLIIGFQVTVKNIGDVFGGNDHYKINLRTCLNFNQRCTFSKLCHVMMFSRQ